MSVIPLLRFTRKVIGLKTGAENKNIIEYFTVKVEKGTILNIDFTIIQIAECFGGPRMFNYETLLLHNNFDPY